MLNKVIYVIFPDKNDFIYAAQWYKIISQMWSGENVQICKKENFSRFRVLIVRDGQQEVLEFLLRYQLWESVIIT